MTYDTINNDVTMPGSEGTLLANRYRIVRQLGQGGMGSVWLAEDTQLDNKQFAIKMLPSILVSNKRAYRQLKDEALVAMKLVHPNIVQIRAFEENNSNPFLVMDYIEGETLDDCLADRCKLSEDETIRILKPIAAALDYAHTKGVVHRDVKPGNVMIDKDGTPYILDFGIAREIQETMTRVTGKLSSGTLLYMSPEQLHGAAPKPAQDIYSFAAMAYECLKGEPPFNRGQIEYQIDNDMPEPLPGGPRSVAAAVMSGLAKKPEDRPPTCLAVIGGGCSGGVYYGWRKYDEGVKARLEGAAFTINDPYGLNLTMKWCPSGTFTMGSPTTEEGRFDGERQHQVTLTKGFWMGETEVTQGQWKKLMDGETIVDLARKGLQDDTVYDIAGKQQTLREFWGMSRDGDPMERCGDLKDDVPVYNVSWNEAVEFCRRLTQRERAAGRIPDGYEYRLPTEAEWEYGCRAGTTTALPNGRDMRIVGVNNAPALDDIAWYSGNSSVGFDGRGWDMSNWPEKQYPGGRACAREVKGKQANNWGLYDMIGNVWEWCGDWYGEYPYGPASDPVGPISGAYRVVRGGSWDGDARSCRPASRAGGSLGFRSDGLGFRVALAPSH